ncbi:hypothetical protein ACFCWB_21750 [Streptomyces bacillaris]|uniref:hypothetical protein n=1 Tax=Streptomyces bacillaris TaxID=68179 RepID=UPI0035D6D649
MNDHDFPDAVISDCRDQLAALGVEVTHAQVRAVGSWAVRWRRGEASLVKLCREGNWPLPPDAAGEPGEVVSYYLRQGIDQSRRTRPADPVERVHAAARDVASVRSYLGELEGDLRTALVEADRAAERDEAGNAPRGHRAALVRAAQPGASRAGVFKALGAGEILAAAQGALRPIQEFFTVPVFFLGITGRGTILRAIGSDADPDAAADVCEKALDALHTAGLQAHLYAARQARNDGPDDTDLAQRLADGWDLVLTRPPAP